MQSSLQSKYLWLVVTGMETCPAEPPAMKPKDQPEADYKTEKKDYLDWNMRDQAAQGLMKSAADETQWPHVTNCKTSKDMWDTWKKIHVTNQQSINIHYYFEELYTRKYTDGSLMADHIAAMLDIRRRIVEAGEKFEDIHLARAMILSLPKTPSWEIIKIQLFDIESSKLTPEIVSTKLQAEANRRIREKAGGNSALLAQGSQKKGQSGGQNKGKGRGPQVEDECRYCHGKGHWANKCAKREEDEKKKNSGNSANLTVSDLQDLGSREVGRVFMATSTGSEHTDVLLDTGATAHMFHDLQLFTSYTPSRSSDRENVSVGDKFGIPVAGRGSVSLKCRFPNAFQTVVFHGALHVSQLAANLVSLGTLQREGAKYQSDGDGILVKLNGDELLRATLIGTLYYLDHIPSGQANAAFSAISSGSLRLWHRRLGHLHLDAIREMVRKDMVSGLKISSPKTYDHVCEGCVVGKSHRLPFPKASTTTYEKMDLLVVDLTGPMSVETWSGMSYALVAIEASCRFGVGEPLKTKDETAETLKTTVTQLERQSGLKLKRIRSDNGTEFVNKIIAAFCKRNGIIHETAVPYGQEQNAIAERSIKTYFEMVRCMLHAAGMDLRYWGEAFMYAVHIRNISPTSALDGKVPFHAWYGRKPNISHIRIFGSIAYANIPKVIRGGKLEKTAVKCRLLGWWADETKGYRLEDLETKRLITSRDVRFVEDEKPNDLAVIKGEEQRVPVEKSSKTEPTGAIRQHTDTEDAEISEPDSPVASEPTSESDFDPEPRFEPETMLGPPPNTAGSSDDVENAASLPRARKSSKWTNLPPREQSTRNRAPAVRYGIEATPEEVDEAANAKNTNRHRAFITLSNEPRTYREAMLSPRSKQWEMAIAAELQQLIKTGTFEWVKKLPEGRRAIGSKLVFREKKDGEGELVKYKARAVVKGFSQVPGQDFEIGMTHAGVMKYATLRALLSLTAREDWELHQIDIVGAYLQGDLEEEIFAECPDGIKVEGKEGWYWLLKKPLYGLKQAGRQWKKKLDEAMRNLGFQKSSADDCLYILREAGVVVLLVLVYVDDKPTAGKTTNHARNFKTEIKKFFDITDLGELKYILGSRSHEIEPRERLRSTKRRIYRIFSVASE